MTSTKTDQDRALVREIIGAALSMKGSDEHISYIQNTRSKYSQIYQ